MRRKDIIRTYYAMEMFCENLGTYIQETVADLCFDSLQLSFLAKPKRGTSKPNHNSIDNASI